MPNTFNGNVGAIFPTWTTVTRSATAQTGETGYNTTTGTLEVYNGTAWIATINYSTSYPVSYLVVAGGGGGGNYNSGGGGGAGGLLTGTAFLVTGTVNTITVGAGGNGAVGYTAAVNGSNSSLIGNSIIATALGGGYGASNGLGNNGGSGGSGGGADQQGGAGSGTFGQGNAGGANNATYNVSPYYPAAGGGGAGAVGGSQLSSSIAGNGGVGLTCLLYTSPSPRDS